MLIELNIFDKGEAAAGKHLGFLVYVLLSFSFEVTYPGISFHFQKREKGRPGDDLSTQFCLFFFLM